MKALQSPYLVQLEDVYENNGTVYIVLEYMHYGSLGNFLEKTFEMDIHLSENFCKWVLYQILLGISYMHSKRVLHRDIKSDNILINDRGEIKICDLGFSVFNVENPRDSLKGTMHWIAPEMWLGQRHTEKMDIYSYGCVAYEFATGYPPFRD